MRCPICEREFDPASPSAAKPFCSERCRLVDLGRWLGEGYSLPSARRGDATANEDADQAAHGDS
jgi:endogenous inhibitor of DNA gyrase (YacG/DUF329 family)